MMVETRYECGFRSSECGITKNSTFRNPHSALNGGFTIITMVIILTLMTISAGVATSFMRRVNIERKELSTEEELKALKEAIIGNPREFTRDGRGNFGYFGDVGGLPGSLQDLLTIPAGMNTYALGTAGQGAGWAGPYVTPIITEDTARLLRDSFGNTYSYTTTAYQRTLDNEWVAARIRSLGPNRKDDGGSGDDTQVEILEKEIRSTVYGYVKDSSGNFITGATVTLYYPYTGSVTSVSTTTAGGLYQFTNVPYGTRTLAVSASVTGSLLYAEGSALAIGNNNGLSFNITNWGSNPITINSIKLDYSLQEKKGKKCEATPAWYEQAWAGEQNVFQYNYDYAANCPNPDNPLCLNYDNNKRRSSGDTLIIKPAITIPGATSTASKTMRVVVASDSVQVPDVIFYPKGGSTLDIRYLNFKDKQIDDKGKTKDVNWGTCPNDFTVTLYYNGSPVPLGPVTYDDPSESFSATGQQ